MNTQVKVKLQVEGLHRWQDCPIAEVSFLRNVHRHVFHVTCVKAVTHNDRDVEIIMFKRTVTDYLHKKYRSDIPNVCYFGRRSCEMIAEDLVRQFDLEWCEVLEDNENGAIVYK